MRWLLRKYTPGNVLLALLWFISFASAIIFFYQGLKGFNIVAGISSFAFIVILIRTLSRQKPHAADLPNMESLFAHRFGFGATLLIVIAGTGFLIVAGLVFGATLCLLAAFAIIGLAIAVSWRRQLTIGIVASGFLVGLVSGLGVAVLGNGDFSWAIFNSLTVPPIFVGGMLLIGHTQFSRVRILEGETSLAMQGFLWACVLAIPASILNLLGDVQASDTWVNHWQQPFYAIVPALAEETWARLFLTTFCYAVLRFASTHHPKRAVLAAILVGAIVHGFAHTGINPIGLVIGSLLYGIPAALLFIKYGFEHAVGYHFMIDFVRFFAALLRI